MLSEGRRKRKDAASKLVLEVSAILYHNDRTALTNTIVTEAEHSHELDREIAEEHAKAREAKRTFENHVDLKSVYEGLRWMLFSKW